MQQCIFVDARIVTGAYDKTVKIWSSDGKLVHRLDTFISNISGLCYVPCCRVMWAAGGTPDAYVYEVKSGDNVSSVRAFPDHRK